MSPKKHVRAEDYFQAEEKAAVCRKFLELTAAGLSLREAASQLKKSPSLFSGENSILNKFQSEGLAGLLPAPRDTSATIQFSLPSWFVPAAKYFYLLSNHRRHGGSVPEAVRRTIDLPCLPLGWTKSQTKHFLEIIKLSEVPECPVELRERIWNRQFCGQPIVPERLARLIAVAPSTVQYSRSPRAWRLDNLSAPGSQRRYFNAETGQREIMLPGDWFGGDDATPGIAVCVPCNEVVTPCSQKYGVLIGRFQWLAFHDCRTDKILSWDYVVRPRGSYRAEDVLHGMKMVTKTHGIPRKGWQFEGGTFDAKLIQQAIKHLGCEHWRTYSPHQKAIESIFNRVWTKLAVQFPHADMGRYRNENESNCSLYEKCKRGNQDPRRFFPSLALVVKVFEEEVREHNIKMIFSRQYGRWMPDELFEQYCTAPGASRLREFSDTMAWVFSPFVVDRKILGTMVRCSVPWFENFSVPFEFSAPWMAEHRGKLVRVHFDPNDPKCRAKIVLLEDSGTYRTGDVLGDAYLVGETGGHIRMLTGFAQSEQRAGLLNRQATARFMHRISHGVGAVGRVKYSDEERRDGLGSVTRIERDKPPAPELPLSTSERIAHDFTRAKERSQKHEQFEKEHIREFGTSPPPDVLSRRIGKIGRLPRALRDEVNQRLESGEKGSVIIAWLNGLPEVRQLLEKEFQGRPIILQNMTKWRRGGFMDWLARKEKKRSNGESDSPSLQQRSETFHREMEKFDREYKHILV